MSVEDDRKPDSAAPGDPGDAALRRAWREVSREQPASATDARILAAARASVAADRSDGASPERRRWNVLQRWQPLLAAAAVAGIAFVLVPMTMSPPPAERATAPTASPAAQSSGSAPAEQAPRPASPTDDGGAGPRPLLQAPATSAKTAESADTASRREVPARSEAGVARSPAAAPPPPAAAESTREAAAPADTSAAPPATGSSSDAGSFGELGDSAPRPSMEREASAARTPENAAAAPTAQMRGKRADQSAEAADMDAWVERIATAYRNGDLATATAELRALRAVEPAADARLPDDVRNWARSVE